MTLLSRNDGERARASFVDFRLQFQRRIRPSAPAPLTHQEIQQETPFDADLVAQLPVLRRYAHKLTRDPEEAMDLVQATCERALRFRHLFREGTSLRAWVLTVMRHHFLDALKRKDAMASGHRVPLEESSEWAQSDARAEQICFVRRRWGSQQRVYPRGKPAFSGPSWRARLWRSVGFATGSPGRRQPLAWIALGPPCAAPARPKAGTRDRTGNKRMIGWSIR